MIKKGDRIKVLEGVYIGKEGEVLHITKAEKSIGVQLSGDGAIQMSTWFKPNEVEKI